MNNSNRQDNRKRSFRDSLHAYDNYSVSLSVEDRHGYDFESCDYSKSKLYQDLKPVLVCMKIFGMYFKRVQLGTKMKTESHVIWCCIFCTLLVLNVIRSLSVYTENDGFWNHALNQKLLCTIWSAECAIKAIVLMFYCYKQNGLPEFFRQWKAICNESGLGTACNSLMLKLIVIAFLFIIFNSIVFPLVLIYNPELECIFLEVSWRNALDYGNHFIFKLLLGGFALLNSASSMFPAIFYILLMLAVGKEFKRYNKDFSSAISDDGICDGDLEECRLRHQKLCFLVETLDRVLSPVIAAIYSANIPMFCFVMYTLTSSMNKHVSLLLINLFWLCFIFLQLCIVSIVAAWVNVQAHGVLDIIYKLRPSHGVSDMQIQLTLFLSRLTGTQIGFTVLSLFVIDRPSILTVIGIMLTYFVVLVQFEQPVTVMPNCTYSFIGSVSMTNNTFVTT